MKDISLELLAVLAILLPGFLAARLVQSFATRNRQSDFDKVVEALVYSFVVYLIYSMGVHTLPIDWRVSKESEKVEHYSVNVDPRNLLLISGISVGFALVVIAVTNNDISGKVLRSLRITSHTARPTVWSDAFHEYQGYVQVELEDGRHVVGWLLRYSSKPEQSTLFLSDAHWLGEDGSEIPIPGKGILLTKDTGIRYVMFLDPAQPAQHRKHHEAKA